MMTQAHSWPESSGHGRAASCQASQPLTCQAPGAQAACAEVQRLLHCQLGNVDVCLHGSSSLQLASLHLQ